MLRKDIVKRSGRNLKQAKTRTFLTSLAISVGAFTIFLAMAAGNGGRDFIDKMGKQTTSDKVTVVAKQDEEIAEKQKEYMSKPHKLSEEHTDQYPRAVFTDEQIDFLREMDGVRRIDWEAYVSPHSVIGKTDEYEASISAYTEQDLTLVAGAIKDKQVGTTDIVVPENFVPIFDTTPEKLIGQTIQFTFEDYSTDQENVLRTENFKVVAVTSSSEYGNFVFYVNNDRILEIVKAISYNHQADVYDVNVYFKKEVDVEKKVEEITKKSDGKLDAYSENEMLKSTRDAVNVAQYALMGFGALALLASVFGIINTQYISVLERTKQIGLMRSLGMKRSDVSKMFRYEAAWVGFLGGMIGVVLGSLVSLIANPVVRHMLTLDKGVSLLQPNVVQATILVLSLMLLSVISGILPARKAAKLDPIEALRTQ